MKNGKIRVAVVDDSKYMRYVISKILMDDDQIEIVCEGRDGLDGIEKILEFKPDVVTLDVEMPRLDGLGTLKKLMQVYPVPVLMVSKLTSVDSKFTIEALQAGAVDVVAKPDNRDALTMSTVREELISKIKIAAKINVNKLTASHEVPVALPFAEKPQFLRKKNLDMRKVLIIASSTGGPKALSEILPKIPADALMGVVIVQHMPAGFTESLAARLDEMCPMHVSEAKQGDIVEQGKILIAPGDYHTRIESGGLISLTRTEPVHNVRPAADVTLEDAARIFGNRVICLVLTGMGKDGTLGGTLVKERGGTTIAQEGSTCVVDGMPSSLIKAGMADRTIPLNKIIDEVLSIIERG